MEGHSKEPRRSKCHETRIIAVGLVLGLVTLVTGTVRADDEAWLHIKVDEGGRHGESVRINLPLSLIEEVLPLVNTDCGGSEVSLKAGKLSIHADDFDIDLPELLKAVRNAKDGEYIRVESQDENVRVAKQDDKLIVHVDEDDEQVRINLRLDLVEAMVIDGEDEIDLVAMVRALRDQGDEDLVVVESDDENVRIWVDDKDTID